MVPKGTLFKLVKDLSDVMGLVQPQEFMKDKGDRWNTRRGEQNISYIKIVPCALSTAIPEISAI